MLNTPTLKYQHPGDDPDSAWNEPDTCAMSQLVRMKAKRILEIFEETGEWQIGKA